MEATQWKCKLFDLGPTKNSMTEVCSCNVVALTKVGAINAAEEAFAHCHPIYRAHPEYYIIKVDN